MIFVIASAPVTPAVTLPTPFVTPAIGSPVQFVSVPLAGVPSAGVVSTGEVSVLLVSVCVSVVPTTTPDGITFYAADPSRLPEAFERTKLEAAIPLIVLLSTLIVLFVNVPLDASIVDHSTFVG